MSRIEHASEPIVPEPESGPAPGRIISAATIIGQGWRVVRDSASEPIAEAQLEDPPPSGRGLARIGWNGGGHHGAPPSDDYSGVSPENALALVEPVYSQPPLPPWFNVRAAEADEEPSPDLVLLKSPNSLAAQQFRALRYRIEQEPDAQIMAVVSPRAGEGKSVTAANLALALSEGGRVKVLLIDAALRSPSQALLFGLRRNRGLTTALGARQFDPYAPVDVVQVRRSLYVLPAGPKVTSPHAALASEAAAHLLGSFRRTFRYILVDASPVFGPAETLAWHGMIDRYIMVARRGVTTTEDLGKASDRLDRDKILGVTFVGVQSDAVAS